MMSRWHRAASLLCFASACATHVASPTATPIVDPLDLYPLSEGNAWSYDVETGEPTTTLAITRVESFDGRVAVVRTGQSLVRYEADARGIRVASQDEWLVRAPVRRGATWSGRGGRIAQVISEEAHAETPAGSFRDCVEVLETGGELELEVHTLYCAGVGPVLVESTMRSKVGDRSLTVRATLRGYRVNPSPASGR